MKTSTLLAVAALVIPAASSAHNGAPQTRAAYAAPPPVRVRAPRAMAPAPEIVMTPAAVRAKPAAGVDRESDHAFRVTLGSSCARLFAVGDGSVRDLAIEVRGPASMRMRQDLSRGAAEALTLCGARGAAYEVTVTAKSSAAAPAVQLRLRAEG